jgi:hypothetical protein
VIVLSGVPESFRDQGAHYACARASATRDIIVVV